MAQEPQREPSASAGSPARTWFRKALPATWVLLVLGSMAHPGDEYGLLVFSSLLGSWLAFLMPNLGSIQATFAPILVVGAGVTFLLGWAFDRLRVSRRLAVAVWLTIALALCGAMLSRYPSLARARSAHGSLLAYVFAALNISLTLCGVLLPLATRSVRARKARRSDLSPR